MGVWPRRADRACSGLKTIRVCAFWLPKWLEETGKRLRHRREPLVATENEDAADFVFDLIVRAGTQAEALRSTSRICCD